MTPSIMCHDGLDGQDVKARRVATEIRSPSFGMLHDNFAWNTGKHWRLLQWQQYTTHPRIHYTIRINGAWDITRQTSIDWPKSRTKSTHFRLWPTRWVQITYQSTSFDIMEPLNAILAQFKAFSKLWFSSDLQIFGLQKWKSFWKGASIEL